MIGECDMLCPFTSKRQMADGLWDLLPSGHAPQAHSSDSSYLNAARRLVYDELCRAKAADVVADVSLLGNKRPRSEGISGPPMAESTAALHSEYLRGYRIHREVFAEVAFSVVPHWWNAEWDAWQRVRRQRLLATRALQDSERLLANLVRTH